MRGGGRINKDAAPQGLTFSSERQAHIEVLWDGQRVSGVMGPFKAHVPPRSIGTQEKNIGMVFAV